MGYSISVIRNAIDSVKSSLATNNEQVTWQRVANTLGIAHGSLVYGAYHQKYNSPTVIQALIKHGLIREQKDRKISIRIGTDKTYKKRRRVIDELISDSQLVSFGEFVRLLADKNFGVVMNVVLAWWIKYGAEEEIEIWFTQNAKR